MIRVIRNTKTNRVVALQVNGKQFSVSKDLGHALALEEENNFKESKELASKAKEIQKSINQKSYVAESATLKLKVCFDEMNRVVSNKTALEFKKSVEPDFKSKFFEVIEDFILALNRAHYQKHLDYSSSVKGLGLESNKKSA